MFDVYVLKPRLIMGYSGLSTSYIKLIDMFGIYVTITLITL